MFTRNWYSGTAYRQLWGNSMAGNMVDVNGETMATSSANPGGICLGCVSTGQTYCNLGSVLTSKPTANGGVMFGTGTTPPQLTDYYISGSVIKGLTHTVTVALSEDDTGYTTSALYTLTNGTDGDITIGEIAVFSGSGSSARGGFMHERTVLDEPVTIPAGGVGQVTYTIRMNYPTV